MDYFTAAQILGRAIDSGTPIGNVAANPFWEHIFPQAAGTAGTQIFGFAPCANGAASLGPGTPVTATQAMYNMYACFPSGNATSALFTADVPLGFPNPGGCFPACATINGQTQGFAFFDPQYASLFGWRSVGNSSYHGLQLSLRRHMKSLSFDLNYTYSKSIDMGSNAERINQFQGFGFASQIVNAWNPRQNRGPSDFDLRHQINANWVVDLPFGPGRRVGAGWHGVTNAILGGWGLSGLVRWSSGFQAAGIACAARVCSTSTRP